MGQYTKQRLTVTELYTIRHEVDFKFHKSGLMYSCMWSTKNKNSGSWGSLIVTESERDLLSQPTNFLDENIKTLIGLTVAVVLLGLLGSYLSGAM